jgi:hypothetical protein
MTAILFFVGLCLLSIFISAARKAVVISEWAIGAMIAPIMIVGFWAFCGAVLLWIVMAAAHAEQWGKILPMCPQYVSQMTGICAAPGPTNLLTICKPRVVYSPPQIKAGAEADCFNVKLISPH